MREVLKKGTELFLLFQEYYNLVKKYCNAPYPDDKNYDDWWECFIYDSNNFVHIFKGSKLFRFAHKLAVVFIEIQEEDCNERKVKNDD